MWVGRDTLPTYLVQHRSGRHLVLPQRARTCGSNTECKDKCGYYKGPVTLMNHVNKGLSRMWTDKTRAKLSYSSITQKMTLHMTPGTEFTIPYHSALVRMLGFEPSVVSSPPASAAADMTRTHVTRDYVERTSVSRRRLEWFCHPKKLPTVRTPIVKRPKTWCTWIKGSIPSTSIQTSWSLA